MSRWWQSAGLLMVCAFFGWVIQQGLHSANPDLWPHVLIPPYALLLYATVASLLNVKSIVVTPAHLAFTNRPIPQFDDVRVPRHDILYVYLAPVVTVDDSGGELILWYTVGVATRMGRDIPVYEMVPDADAGIAKARALVEAFGVDAGGSVLEFRRLGRERDHPADWRQARILGGATVLAFVSGFLWDLVLRLNR